MDNKKRILESPYFILVIVIVTILFGLMIVDQITKSKDDTEIPEQEEIIEIIPYTNYDWNKLTRDNNYYKYEDENYYSMFGIDVAAHQETIDWKKVKEAGVEFAYIRLGYRGCDEGLLHTDLEFENNYKGAIDNGIKVGVYWYSQPVNEEEVIEEANYVIDVLNGRHLDLPIAYDFEETVLGDGTISRMHDMSKEDRTKMAVTFCNEIIKNHQNVMIYTNLDWIDNYYSMSELSEYPIWYAQYTDIPQYTGPIKIWQYAEYGYVNGIETSTDLDIMFIQKNNQN